MRKSPVPLADAASSPNFRVKKLAAACALLMVESTGASAQAVASAQATADSSQTVVVTGIRRSIESSIASKRNSDSVTETVSAEDLGKLPDASIAEALARLPGLTGQRGTDGRVNVISIRGLSPAFSGALLNGREIVSSNDGRAVEYDQFPSELIGSGVVYKTPNAALIGQGLSGTVDLRARRPLDTRGREIAVNIRAEDNSNGTQVSDVSSPIGNRFSVSYVNQFADNTVGVAVGFAHLKSVTQLRVSELDQYGDYTPYGLPLNGTVPSLFQAPSVSWGPVSQALLPMFWTGSQATKENTRDGLMVVLEFKPNKDLHSQVDLYYSKFDTHEVGGKLTSNMFANWGIGAPGTLTDVGTTQVGKNTYATTATNSRLPTTTTNWDTKREDTISAIGWNTSLRLANKWTLASDLSYSRDVRDEKYKELYAGPWNNAANDWAYGPFKWNVPVNGDPQSFTPLQPGFLSTASGIKFGDVGGFGYVPGDTRWTGVIRDPKVEDVIKSLRLSATRPLDGIFSAVTGGFNYTQRDKTVEKNETRLLIPLTGNYTCGALACNRDVPAAAIRTPFDMSWMGVPQMVRIDVPYLIDSGTLSLRPAELGLKANDSSVHEKVSTAFAMLDIGTEVLNTPIRGNIGVQYVHTTQDSEGWEYRGNNDNVDFNLLYKRVGGTSYNDILPSLNLVAELQSDLIARFGWGMATARPQINDMRAGTSTPELDLNPGLNQGFWSTAYAGNPELKPWKAAALDLSLEKYFGKRSYISAAAFRKKLLSYITYGISPRDNSSLPIPATAPAGIVVQKFGDSFQPLNGNGGLVTGIEFAASLEGALLTPVLDGFGLVYSASWLDSTISDQKVDQNSGRVIAGSKTTINGLSGFSENMTVYYEKYGYSARISKRYRSSFTATTRDIFFRPTTKEQGADKVVDLQLGYDFGNAGTYKGLSLLLQVNNLTDTYTRNYKSIGNVDVPEPDQLVPNYTYQFGRQVLFGMNYKF